MVHSGSPKHLQFMLSFYDGIRYAWANDVVTAKVRIDKCRALAAELKYQVWGAPLVGWLTAEVALCEGDFSAGVLATQAMVESAIELQHEQFASLGLNLMAFVLARQGNPTDALNALKQLSAREQAIRTESLVHRQRIVDWQAKLYEQRNDAVQWQASSSHYHILSMQDPLTGLANRRGFDEALQAHSSLNKTLQLHVIALDVDQFKSVNDNFSHLIGDKVLQAIGATLQAQLRQHDIAARIGGDEFMLALQGVGDHQALVVCERIRSAVMAYPWAAIAPGLSVTVSLGCSSAEPGDTTESLVMRSDRQMYADKGARRQALGGRPD
jgi:diguanylate cyclase (GGDEF)-like protein